jgi:hypothetical protein
MGRFLKGNAQKPVENVFTLLPYSEESGHALADGDVIAEFVFELSDHRIQGRLRAEFA